MSELHNTPATGAPPASHEHPVDFSSYVRRCTAVFIAALIFIGLMIWVSYLPPEHFSWSVKVALILVFATCNGFIVAGFLMHLLSERKMIYTILAFTVSFVIGLFALTLYAMHDFPKNTVIH